MLAIAVPESEDAGEGERQALQEALEAELSPGLLERAAGVGWTLGEFLTEALTDAGVLDADGEGEATAVLQ